MGDPSTLHEPQAAKKYKTDLTDYSIRHSSNTGPYADNLDVDAIIVGGGFSVPSPSLFPTSEILPPTNNF